ncbi:MAG TPA: hypothetical protein VH951_05280 [Dehalococcoidia bacterium]
MAEAGTPTRAPDEDQAPDKRYIKGVGSYVTLDFRTGAVHKMYQPRLAVRLLYWLAFQAPFPYSTDRDALEASRERRVIVGLLTKYWFGIDIVAPVLGIEEDEQGNAAFVTELVRGHEPDNKYRARRFLKILTAHFIESGLPTWQVSPHNPRSVGNLMEVDDGSYRIIDLESNLVAALTPMSAVTSAIRQKNFPNFDDIDTSTLEAYLAKNGRRIRDKLGGEDYLKLMDSAIAYSEYVKRWHSREPRIVGKVLGVMFGPVYAVSAFVRRFKRALSSGQLRAEIFIRRGIVKWVNEGKMTQEEAAKLRRALREPEVAQALNYIGVNMALNVIIFIPFVTSFIRFVWTLILRLKGEIKGLITHRAPHTERDLHTMKVAVFGLLPKLGAGAYFFSGPLTRNRGLFAVGIDRLLRKAPLGLYRRLKLERIGNRVMQSGRAALGAS